MNRMKRIHTRDILTALLLIPTMFALGACQTAWQARQKADADEFAVKYFGDLKNNPNIMVLPSGVMYEILRPGAGPFPTANDTAKVNYIGRLADGAIFDSSYDRDEPADFPLNKLVPGMTEALQKINKGGKIRIHIPYEQGYGGDEQGDGKIPAYSILVFEVELLDFRPTPMSSFY